MLGIVTLRFVALTLELARPRVLRAAPAALVVTRWWPWGPRRRTLVAASVAAITAADRVAPDVDGAVTQWEIRAELTDGTAVTLLEADDGVTAAAVAAAVRAHLGRARA